MKKLILGVIIALILVLSMTLPVSAEPTSSIELSYGGVEIIAGGEVGVETTVRVTANVNAEAITDATIRKDMAAISAYIRYWVIDPNWKPINGITGIKAEQTSRDYENYANEDGAHAVMDWDFVGEYTFIPEYSGNHYVSTAIYTHISVTDGSWPPNWIWDYQMEYFYSIFEITEANPQPPASWYSIDTFEVAFGNFACHHSYGWTGISLTEEVNLSCVLNSHVMNITIPNGTVCLGTNRFKIMYDGGLVIEEPQNALFSNPVTITIDGNQTVFKQITNGIPQ